MNRWRYNTVGGALAFVVLIGFVGASAHRKKGRCPFRDGVIEKVDPIRCIGRYVNVFGKDSDLRAAMSGEVIRVMQIGDSWAVMFKSGGLFYTYYPLDSSLVFRHQRVIEGQVIGFSALKTIEFVVSDIKNRDLPPEDFVDCRCKLANWADSLRR